MPADQVLRYSAFPADPTDPGGGNPAGLVLDARHLDAAARIAVAAEVGDSETAFLSRFDPSTRAGELRFASPRVEVAFCGHATMATAVALAERHGPGPLTFATTAGEITVSTATEAGSVRATILSIPARSRPATDDEVDDALATFRPWGRQDLDPEHPVHVAFAGEHHLVLPLANREQLRRLDYDFDGLATVMSRHGWTTVHATWRESPARWHAREPFPVAGVVEDPATGAAAAAFGGYLRALDLVPAGRQLEIIQGEDMGRPSRLVLDLPPETDRSHVSGTAVALET